MPTTNLDLATPDGPCPTEVVTPDGDGPWPVVLLCHDAAGARPSMTEIATRIAADGHLVAIPDLFHRSGSPSALLPKDVPIDIAAIRAIFADPERRARFQRDYYLPALDYGNLHRTVAAVLDHLAGRDDVTGKVGTTGYCMGGNASFRIATVLGDRITTTACFHPGGLVTDQPDSPHLRCGEIRSRVLVAGAANDANFSDAARATLDAALTAAGVEHTVEVYPGRHGFAVRDHDVFDEACAERHFLALHDLFAATLR
ncbi:MAG TPA: dienelactone hydrolase family protein [Kofleriaceae bacterium]|nr:dienelactone hydrolase family protein [Kofleriaceae bacterium]